MPPEGPATPLTRSVERATDILAALGDHGAPMGVTALARQLGLGKGTVHRLLQTLTARRLVTYVPASQSYALGGGMLQLGLSAQERLPIREIVRPTLRVIRDITGETATLHLAAGTQQVAVEAAIAPREPRRVPNLGELHPLHQGAAGKVLLAWQPPDIVDAYLAATPLRATTPQTITDRSMFRAALEAARAAGYAVSLEELRPRTNGLAFPLLNGAGQLTGAIGVAGPAQRWDATALRAAAPACLRAIQQAAPDLAACEPMPGTGAI